MMTGPEYQAAIDTMGLSQVAAGKFFEASPRSSRRWASGQLPVPPLIEKMIRLMLAKGLTPAQVEELKQ